MARLHRENRYDRLTQDVAKVTGELAIGVRDYVSRHPEIFRSVAATADRLPLTEITMGLSQFVLPYGSSSGCLRDVRARPRGDLARNR